MLYQLKKPLSQSSWVTPPLTHACAVCYPVSKNETLISYSPPQALSKPPALWLPMLPCLSSGIAYGTQHLTRVWREPEPSKVFSRKELSRPNSVFICSLCAPDEIREPSCLEHICEHHSDQIGELNCSRLLDCLEQANSGFNLNTCAHNYITV